MATTIRLKRVGAKKEPSYRIVVTDTREGTSGASIERLGTYNPRTTPSLVRVDAARTIHWLREGAEPSDTVRSLLKKAGIWKQFKDGVEPADIEQALIELGPPEGDRSTSQRPVPVDRQPKEYAEPAPEPGSEEEAAAVEAEADEEPVEAEAEEEPAAEAEEAAEDDGPEETAAEADEAPADEEPEEASAEAATDDSEAEEDSEEDSDEGTKAEAEESEEESSEESDESEESDDDAEDDKDS